MQVTTHLGKDACLLISPPSQAVVLHWTDTAAVSMGKDETKLNQLFPTLLFPTALLLTLKMLCPTATGSGWNRNRWILHPSVSDKLTFLEHLKTLLGKEPSCCSLAHLIFLSLHPKMPHPGLSKVLAKWAFMVTNHLPRSCSWQVMPLKGIHIAERQRHREECRNSVNPSGSLSPALWAADYRTLKQRQEHAFSSLAVEQQKLCEVGSSREQDAAPLFSQEHLSNTSGYSGRSLQSWGGERRQHAGQSRTCSWCCRCGHGKEKDNRGSFCRGYLTSKLKVAPV